MVAGGDCIDDVDVLRCGSTDAVVGHRRMAPSTIGTFLRSFTFGHVRQLDRLFAMVLSRAWAAGAGPRDEPMTIDLDSTICEVHGYDKGGAAYGYTKMLGYHPLLATRADTGEILHVRQRKGSAASGRGAQRFIEELVAPHPPGGRYRWVDVTSRFGVLLVEGDRNPQTRALSSFLCEVVVHVVGSRRPGKVMANAFECLFPSLGSGAEFTSSVVPDVADRQIEDLQHGVFGGEMPPGFW